MTQDLINNYIANPNDFYSNIELAAYYEKTGQLGSAVSHYLKAADLAEQNKTFAYIAVSGTARCFTKAGGRDFTVEGLLKRAVALAPEIPVPYVELCKYYESKGAWFDCYMLASIDLTACAIRSNWLVFYKGVSAWWIGNTQEARELIYCLWVQREKFDKEFVNLVRNNIYSIDEPYAYSRHRKELNMALKRDVPGIENVDITYSQCNQDMFAAMVAKGKRDGFYLEIGSGDPEHHNNTCMLERSYNWKGISIDINFSATQRFRAIRSNPCIMGDATKLDYKQILSEAPKEIDYLQIDVDPPQSLSLDVLYKIPFDDYIFKAITFEHNAYETWPDSIKEKSREYLKNKGYRLVVSDIAVREDRSFEDWWIHKSVKDFAKHDMDVNGTPKTAKSYFYNMEEFEKLHLTAISNWVTL